MCDSQCSAHRLIQPRPVFLGSLRWHSSGRAGRRARLRWRRRPRITMSACVSQTRARAHSLQVTAAAQRDAVVSHHGHQRRAQFVWGRVRVASATRTQWELASLRCSLGAEVRGARGSASRCLVDTGQRVRERACHDLACDARFRSRADVGTGQVERVACSTWRARCNSSTRGRRSGGGGATGLMAAHGATPGSVVAGRPSCEPAQPTDGRS